MCTDFSLQQPDVLRHGWMYGGDLASQALFCAYQTVEEHLRLSSFHSYFCSPGVGKPMEFDVKRLRDGKNTSYRRVEIRQEGKLAYHAEFMFKQKSCSQAAPIKEFSFPQVPDPSALRTSFEHFEELLSQGVDPRTLHGVVFADDLGHIDHRPCNGAEFLHGPAKPSLTQSLWARYKIENFEQHPRFSDLIVAYMADMGICFAGCMPFPRRDFKLIVSVDLAGWIHHDFDSIRPNEFFLYETQCMVHSGGNKALNLGRLWTRDGTLVATTVQDALVEPNPEAPESKL